MSRRSFGGVVSVLWVLTVPRVLGVLVLAVLRVLPGLGVLFLRTAGFFVEGSAGCFGPFVGFAGAGFLGAGAFGSGVGGAGAFGAGVFGVVGRFAMGRSSCRL
jgi:hypothetical protein